MPTISIQFVMFVVIMDNQKTNNMKSITTYIEARKEYRGEIFQYAINRECGILRIFVTSTLKSLEIVNKELKILNDFDNAIFKQISDEETFKIMADELLEKIESRKIEKMSEVKLDIDFSKLVAACQRNVNVNPDEKFKSYFLESENLEFTVTDKCGNEYIMKRK